MQKDLMVRALTISDKKPIVGYFANGKVQASARGGWYKVLTHTVSKCSGIRLDVSQVSRFWVFEHDIIGTSDGRIGVVFTESSNFKVYLEESKKIEYLSDFLSRAYRHSNYPEIIGSIIEGSQFSPFDMEEFYKIIKKPLREDVAHVIFTANNKNIVLNTGEDEFAIASLEIAEDTVGVSAKNLEKFFKFIEGLEVKPRDCVTLDLGHSGVFKLEMQKDTFKIKYKNSVIAKFIYPTIEEKYGAFTSTPSKRYVI